MSLDQVLSLLVSALLLGGLYAVMSFGLGLIYGVLRIINLAHAGVLMFGAYTAFSLITTIPALKAFPFAVVVVVAPLFFLLGVILQRTMVRRVQSAPPIASLLLLFGVWLILQNFAYLIWSGDTRSIFTDYTLATIRIGGLPMSINRLVVFGWGALILVGLHWFLTRTYLGRAIRAISQDRDACLLVGINAERVSAIAFGLGISLAGVAGSLMALIFAFDPDFGRSHMLKAFVIIVLGSLESVIGVALGALILALTEQLSVLWIPPALQDFVSYLLLVVVLIALPGGLLTLLPRLRRA